MNELMISVHSSLSLDLSSLISGTSTHSNHGTMPTRQFLFLSPREEMETIMEGLQESGSNVPQV